MCGVAGGALPSTKNTRATADGQCLRPPSSTTPERTRARCPPAPQNARGRSARADRLRAPSATLQLPRRPACRPIASIFTPTICRRWIEGEAAGAEINRRRWGDRASPKLLLAAESVNTVTRSKAGCVESRQHARCPYGPVSPTTGNSSRPSARCAAFLVGHALGLDHAALTAHRARARGRGGPMRSRRWRHAGGRMSRWRAPAPRSPRNSGGCHSS